VTKEEIILKEHQVQAETRSKDAIESAISFIETLIAAWSPYIVDNMTDPSTSMSCVRIVADEIKKDEIKSPISYQQNLIETLVATWSPYIVDNMTDPSGSLPQLKRELAQLPPLGESGASAED
jgi:hypothetical protein